MRLSDRRLSVRTPHESPDALQFSKLIMETHGMANEPAKPLVQTIKDWLQIILLVFGAGWGVYTFVYKEIILPTRRPAALRLSATLEEIGRKGNMVLVRARIAATNQSDTKIYVPAFWYTATAFKLNAGEMSDSAYATYVEGALQQQFERMNRYSREDSGDVVATWRVPIMEWWYEPKDETVHEQLFYVPADRYDAVQLHADVWLTKSIDELAPIDWRVAASGELVPYLLFKASGYEQDHSRVEPFDLSNARQKKWQLRNGVAHNECVATLSLLRRDAGSVPAKNK